MKIRKLKKLIFKNLRRKKTLNSKVHIFSIRCQQLQIIQIRVTPGSSPKLNQKCQKIVNWYTLVWQAVKPKGWPVMNQIMICAAFSYKIHNPMKLIEKLKIKTWISKLRDPLASPQISKFNSQTPITPSVSASRRIRSCMNALRVSIWLSPTSHKTS